MRDLIIGVLAGMFLMIGGWYVFWPVTTKVIDVATDHVPPPALQLGDEASRQIILGRIIKVEQQLGLGSLTTIRRGLRYSLISLSEWCNISRVRGNCDGKPQPADWSFVMPYPIVARRIHPQVNYVLLWQSKDDKVQLAIYPDASGKLEWLLFTRKGWHKKDRDYLRIRLLADVKPIEPFDDFLRHDNLYVAPDPVIPIDSYRTPHIDIYVRNKRDANVSRRWDDILFERDLINARGFLFTCLLAPLSEGADSPACVKPAEKRVAVPDASLPAKERKFADRRNRWSRAGTQTTRALRGAAPGSMTVEQCTAAGIKDLLRPSDKPDFVDDEFWYQNLVNIVHTTWSQCFEALKGRKGWKETFGARYKRFFNALPSVQKRKAAADAKQPGKLVAVITPREPRKPAIAKADKDKPSTTGIWKKQMLDARQQAELDCRISGGGDACEESRRQKPGRRIRSITRILDLVKVMEATAATMKTGNYHRSFEQALSRLTFDNFVTMAGIVKNDPSVRFSIVDRFNDKMVGRVRRALVKRLTSESWEFATFSGKCREVVLWRGDASEICDVMVSTSTALEAQEFRPPQKLDPNLSPREFGNRRDMCISALATYNASNGKNIRPRQGCPRRGDLKAAATAGETKTGFAMPQAGEPRRRRFAPADPPSSTEKQFSAAFDDALRFARRRPRDQNQIYQFNRTLRRKLRGATVSDFESLATLMASSPSAALRHLKGFPPGNRRQLNAACHTIGRRYNASTPANPVQLDLLCGWITRNAALGQDIKVERDTPGVGRRRDSNQVRLLHQCVMAALEAQQDPELCRQLIK